MIRPRFAALPAVLMLAACAVGPDYQAPKATIVGHFAEGGAQPIGAASAQRWWYAFDDRMLNELVQAGLAQNLDIQSAIARVAEAQAAARATGLPALIDGSITAQSTRSGGQGVSTTTAHSATFSPSILFDLFGGAQRSREQALASLQSAELSVGEARLAFLSSVVSTYIDMRYYQEALALTRQTAASRRETLKLVQFQRQAGTATELDEAQAQASLDETLATLPALESGFHAATYAIATLLAQPVQGLSARLQRGASQLRPGSKAAVGVPADLLRNRPDIGAAERDYAAAVAAIGVSEAELFPSLSLSGSVTAATSNSWTFGPSLSLPVLTQGVLRANRAQAVAQAEQARLAWHSTVLGAVEEVQAAQSDYLRNRRAVVAYRRSVGSYARVVELSRETHELGTTTLIDLLESQRSLASAQLSLASGARDLAASWATLQIAAGLGWALPVEPGGG